MNTRISHHRLLCLLIPGLLGLGLAPTDLATAAGQDASSGEAVEDDGGAVLATVNGEKVLLEDVEQRLASLHGGAREGSRGSFDLDRLMFQVVNDVLIGQEARVLELDEDEDVREDVDEFVENRILARLERVEILDKSRPTSDEIDSYYEDQYRQANLTVITTDTREEAEEVKKLLRDGAVMEDLARERSVDPYAPRGGKVTGIPRVDLPVSMAEITFALEPGEIGGPVLSDRGWTVLRVESFKDADPEKFADVEKLVRRVVSMLKGRELREALAARLKKKHPVVLDDEVFASVRPQRLPDGRIMPEVADKEAVLVRIGDRVTITAGEFARALAERWSGVRSVEAAEAAAPIILGGMVDRQVLLAEALAREYDELPDVQQAAYAYETQLLIPLYLDEVIADNVEVTTEEMRAHYEENKEQFHRPPRVRLGQITVETRDEAEEVARMLRSGTDLSWLARQRSIDRFKDSGGDRGWYTPNPTLPGFDARLLEAKKGEVLDPTGMPGNFVVNQVLAREEQGIYDFNEISGNIRQMVYDRKTREALGAHIDKLRERAEVEVNDEVLARLDIVGSREDRPAAPAGDHGH